MRRVRLSWLIVALVVIATAIAPPLRHQAWAPVAVWRWYHGRHDPVAFVNRYYPHDPQMLLAAGVEGNDRGMLRHAIAAGAGPAAWAALTATYAEKIRAPRIGAAGVDPANTVMVRETEQQLKADWAKERATLGDQHEMLDALHGWEHADPQNGLPLALETVVLYGIDRDAEALARWREAGRRPLVTMHRGEVEKADTPLQQRLGAPYLESVTAVATTYGIGISAQLREAARFTQYEGRKAQLEGRAQEAVAIWNATADFGYHMQQSAETIVDYLVGSALEGIGAAPTWEWHIDSTEPDYSDPNAYRKGRVWFGEQHAFFLAHASVTRDVELRDRRVLGMSRVTILRHFIDADPTLRYLDLDRSLGLFGLALLGSAAGLFVCFLLVSVAHRKEADVAVGSRAWTVLFPVASALGIALVAIEIKVGAYATYMHMAMPVAPSMWSAWLPGATPLTLCIVAFLFALLFARRRTPAWFAAWRGNLRRALPPTIALLVLCYLGTVIAAIAPRAEATRLLSQNEMAALRRFAGPSWDHPKIPADAWRAAYPPQTTATGATP
jgi:hypothetical protein